MRANSFLLCMASPVLHKMLCGNFKEGITRRFSLEDVDGKAFEEVLNLWCGKEGCAEQDLRHVLVMASVADRLEMLDVAAALEVAIIGELRSEVCVEVLMSSRELGLRQVEEAAWGVAVERFNEVSGTAGFMRLDEETVASILEQDGLGVWKEEEAFEGLVGWMKGDAGGVLRGRELLRQIRFGVMEQGYLKEKARGMLPEEYREWMESLVGEALRVKAAVRAKAAVEPGQLGVKALTRRRGRGVEWGRYAEGGGGRRLAGHSYVHALVECEGRMCSGSEDGSIHLWSLASLDQERVLISQEDGCVYALAAWEGRLISGHESGRVRVWDVDSGELLRALAGHTGRVRSLCAVGSRLASGSNDRSIKVWAMGPGPEWRCERTLTGPTSWVASLAGWEGKLISGSGHDRIQVWDLETGRVDATLTAQPDSTRIEDYTVHGLLVHGERLYGTSWEGTIRVWEVGTWAAVATVQVYDRRISRQCLLSLAVSGSRLVGGSVEYGPLARCEVLVWDLDSLACEHTVLQPSGAAVSCLAAAGAEVWGGVGTFVVVWGRE